MRVRHITPILNVSELARSMRWFESLGWTRGFEWGEPPTFGSGAEAATVDRVLRAEARRHCLRRD